MKKILAILAVILLMSTPVIAQEIDFWIKKMKKIVATILVMIFICFFGNTNSNAQYWAKTYGDFGAEPIYSVQQTSDGGYIVAGVIYQIGVYFDSLLLKLDSNGNAEWQKFYGGSNWDYARLVQQTSDGGYVVAGETEYNGVVFDYSYSWLLKLDSMGSVEWHKTYRANRHVGNAWSLQVTSDGGYVLAGHAHTQETYSDDYWCRSSNGCEPIWNNS